MFAPSLCLGLLEIAKQQLTQGVSGKPNYVWDEVTGKPLLGRFGRKANQPTLRRPIAAALLNDIGATSSVFPVDNGPTRQTARELKTGAATTIPSQSNITFRPYTDLLLHDMGVELADGRPDFHADGREWRTAPLWGIGRRRETQNHSDLLHDRRARNVAEAGLWHGGEAQLAREAFRRRSKSERAALIRFVESL